MNTTEEIIFQKIKEHAPDSYYLHTFSDRSGTYINFVSRETDKTEFTLEYLPCTERTASHMIHVFGHSPGTNSYAYGRKVPLITIKFTIANKAPDFSVLHPLLNVIKNLSNDIPKV